MTDKEIIKAIEICHDPGAGCNDCPYIQYVDCGDLLRADTFDLAIRQQAEIEEKKELLKVCEIGIKDVKNLVIQNRKTTLQIYNDYEQKITISRAEAVKEFADKLKAEYKGIDETYHQIFYSSLVAAIDNLVKEMVGADDGQDT